MNPKDIVGSSKVPLGLLPAIGRIEGARACAEGAKKYGPYNWRDEAVLLSVYLDAMERHLLCIREGQWMDSSGVPHLGHIIAGASIVLDAASIGKLIDDLPAVSGRGPHLFETYRKRETSDAVAKCGNSLGNATESSGRGAGGDCKIPETCS